MPLPVVGPAVWKPRDFLGESSWTRVFTAAELREIHGAMQKVNTYGSEPKEVTANVGPLPVLKATMDHVRDDLLTRWGFSVLRGLDVENYDSETLNLLYGRLGAHLGEIAPQNAEGDLLRHVTDLGDLAGHGQDASRARGHRGHAQMFPHTDSSYMVGLLCVRQAKKGGGNTVSSSLAIHNEILRTHPEYLSPLYDGFYFDLTGKGGNG